MQRDNRSRDPEGSRRRWYESRDRGPRDQGDSRQQSSQPSQQQSQHPQQPIPQMYQQHSQQRAYDPRRYEQSPMYQQSPQYPQFPPPPQQYQQSQRYSSAPPQPVPGYNHSYQPQHNSQRPQTPSSVFSSSSDTSTSLLDISRYKDTKQFGGVFGTFFKAPSDRVKQRLHRKKKQKRRVLYFGNSSSSSVNSDLAYGQGYVRQPKSRTLSPRSQSRASGQGYAFSPGHGPTQGHRRRSSGGSDRASRPTPRKKTADEEIMALGQQLSDLARRSKEDEQRLSSRGSGKGKAAALGLAAGAAMASGYGRHKHGSRGLGSSKQRVDTSDDDSDWEDASDNESSSSDDAGSAADSELAYGVVGESIKPAAGAAAAAGTASPTTAMAGSRRPSGQSPMFDPRRYGDRGSIVDPRLFGPYNSLRGSINTPCGFRDEEQAAAYRRDSASLEAGGPIHMRDVYPVPISEPYRFDGDQFPMSDRRPDSSTRPAPVPLQQPVPKQAVSSKVYNAEKFDDINRGEPRQRTSEQPDGKSWAGVATAGLAAAAVGTAMASSASLRKNNSENHDGGGHDRANRDRREQKLIDLERRKALEAEEQKLKELEHAKAQELDRRKVQDPERQRLDWEQRLAHHTQRQETLEDERERNVKWERDYRGSDPEPIFPKYNDEQKSSRRYDHDDTPTDRMEKKNVGVVDVPQRDQGGVEAFHSEAGPEFKVLHEPAVQADNSERDLPLPIGAGHRPPSDSTQPVHETVDPFQYQVADDAFTVSQRTTPGRPLTPNVVTIEREPNFDDSPPGSSAADARLSRRDSFEIERMVDEYRRETHDPPQRRDTQAGHEFEEDERKAKSILDEAKHATIPVAAAAIASAVAVEHERSQEHGHHRQSNGRSQDGSRGRKDTVQEEADRFYREACIARKIASDELRSRSASPERSVVDKWQEDKNDPFTIVTPPIMEDKHPDKNIFDGPDADVKIDNKIYPREERHFRNLGDNSSTLVLRSREPSRERPVLNLIYPTPATSRQHTPAPQAQGVRQADDEVPTPDDASIGPKGEIISAGELVSVPKSVSWGENETKSFEVDTPENRSDSDNYFPTDKSPDKPRPKLNKASRWGILAAALAGSSAEPHNEPDFVVSSKTSDIPRSFPDEASRVIFVHQAEDVSGDDVMHEPPIPGPKPPSPHPQQMPGGFADDFEFAATLAAGLKDTGFNPDIVIDDPSYSRRDSPPGVQEANGDSHGNTNGNTWYKRPSAEAVPEPRNDNIPNLLPEQGFILGEVETPQEPPFGKHEGERHFEPDSLKPEDVPLPQDNSETSKSSKREPRKRDKSNVVVVQDDGKIENIKAEPSPSREVGEEVWEDTTRKRGQKDRKCRDPDDMSPSISSTNHYASDAPARDTRSDHESEPRNTFAEYDRSQSFDTADIAKVAVPALALGALASSSSRITPSRDVRSEDEQDAPRKSHKPWNDDDYYYDDNRSRVSAPVQPSHHRHSSRDISSRDVRSDDEREDHRHSSKHRKDRDSRDDARYRDSSTLDPTDRRRPDDDERPKRSKRHTYSNDSPTRSLVASEISVGSSSSKRSKRSKRRSGAEEDFDDSRESPSDRRRDFFDDRDVSSVVSESRGDDRRRESGHRRKFSRYDDDDDDVKSVASMPGSSHRGKEYKERRTPEKRPSNSVLSSLFKSRKDKKDSFLDNAGTLGAGVGLASAAAIVASDAARSNAAETSSDHENSVSRDGRPRARSFELVDPEVVPRVIKPAIDPQYGDLLPLPPSEPTSPSSGPEELPPLPDSRPDTPPEERIIRRDSRTHQRRRSVFDTPTKSPSRTAVPIALRLGNRSNPASPVSFKASPASSPITSHSDAVVMSRRAARPTSWDNSREIMPLYLLEHSRHQQPTTGSVLPALPPSEPSETSARNSPEPEFLKHSDDYFGSGLDFAGPDLRVDTELSEQHPKDSVAGSQETTPRAEFMPTLPDSFSSDTAGEHEKEPITYLPMPAGVISRETETDVSAAPLPFDASATAVPTTLASHGFLEGQQQTHSPADKTDNLTSADKHFSDALEGHPEQMSLGEAVLKSVAESATEPVTEPVTEPATEPVTEPATEPVAEPTIEPATEPVAEPVAEPTIEPATEPATEPVAEPVAEPTIEPATEPATEPVAEPVTEPAPEPATEPVAEPAPEPATEPITEATSETAPNSSTLCAEAATSKQPVTPEEDKTVGANDEVLEPFLADFLAEDSTRGLAVGSAVEDVTAPSPELPSQAVEEAGPEMVELFNGQNVKTAIDTTYENPAFTRAPDSIFVTDPIVEAVSGTDSTTKSAAQPMEEKRITDIARDINTGITNPIAEPQPVPAVVAHMEPATQDSETLLVKSGDAVAHRAENEITTDEWSAMNAKDRKNMKKKLKKKGLELIIQDSFNVPVAAASKDDNAVLGDEAVVANEASETKPAMLELELTHESTPQPSQDPSADLIASEAAKPQEPEVSHEEQHTIAQSEEVQEVVEQNKPVDSNLLADREAEESPGGLDTAIESMVPLIEPEPVIESSADAQATAESTSITASPVAETALEEQLVSPSKSKKKKQKSKIQQPSEEEAISVEPTVTEVEGTGPAEISEAEKDALDAWMEPVALIEPSAESSETVAHGDSGSVAESLPEITVEPVDADAFDAWAQPDTVAESQDAPEKTHDESTKASDLASESPTVSTQGDSAATPKSKKKKKKKGARADDELVVEKQEMPQTGKPLQVEDTGDNEVIKDVNRSSMEESPVVVAVPTDVSQDKEAPNPQSVLSPKDTDQVLDRGKASPAEAPEPGDPESKDDLDHHPTVRDSQTAAKDARKDRQSQGYFPSALRALPATAGISAFKRMWGFRDQAQSQNKSGEPESDAQTQPGAVSADRSVATGTRSDIITPKLDRDAPRDKETTSVSARNPEVADIESGILTADTAPDTHANKASATTLLEHQISEPLFSQGDAPADESQGTSYGLEFSQVDESVKATGDANRDIFAEDEVTTTTDRELTETAPVSAVEGDSAETLKDNVIGHLATSVVDATASKTKSDEIRQEDSSTIATADDVKPPVHESTEATYKDSTTPAQADLGQLVVKEEPIVPVEDERVRLEEAGSELSTRPVEASTEEVAEGDASKTTEGESAKSSAEAIGEANEAHATGLKKKAKKNKKKKKNQPSQDEAPEQETKDTTTDVKISQDVSGAETAVVSGRKNLDILAPDLMAESSDSIVENAFIDQKPDDESTHGVLDASGVKGRPQFDRPAKNQSLDTASVGSLTNERLQTDDQLSEHGHEEMLSSDAEPAEPKIKELSQIDDHSAGHHVPDQSGIGKEPVEPKVEELAHISDETTKSELKEQLQADGQSSRPEAEEQPQIGDESSEVVFKERSQTDLPMGPDTEEQTPALDNSTVLYINDESQTAGVSAGPEIRGEAQSEKPVNELLLDGLPSTTDDGFPQLALDEALPPRRPDARPLEVEAAKEEPSLAAGNFEAESEKAEIEALLEKRVRRKGRLLKKDQVRLAALEESAAQRLAASAVPEVREQVSEKPADISNAEGSQQESETIDTSKKAEGILDDDKLHSTEEVPTARPSDVVKVRATEVSSESETRDIGQPTETTEAATSLPVVEGTEENIDVINTAVTSKPQDAIEAPEGNTSELTSTKKSKKKKKKKSVSLVENDGVQGAATQNSEPPVVLSEPSRPDESTTSVNEVPVAEPVPEDVSNETPSKDSQQPDIPPVNHPLDSANESTAIEVDPEANSAAIVEEAELEISPDKKSKKKKKKKKTAASDEPEKQPEAEPTLQESPESTSKDLISDTAKNSAPQEAQSDVGQTAESSGMGPTETTAHQDEPSPPMESEVIDTVETTLVDDEQTQPADAKTTVETPSVKEPTPATDKPDIVAPDEPPSENRTEVEELDSPAKLSKKDKKKKKKAEKKKAALEEAQETEPEAGLATSSQDADVSVDTGINIPAENPQAAHDETPKQTDDNETPDSAVPSEDKMTPPADHINVPDTGNSGELPSEEPAGSEDERGGLSLSQSQTDQKKKAKDNDFEILQDPETNRPTEPEMIPDPGKQDAAAAAVDKAQSQGSTEGTKRKEDTSIAGDLEAYVGSGTKLEPESETGQELGDRKEFAGLSKKQIKKLKKVQALAALDSSPKPQTPKETGASSEARSEPLAEAGLESESRSQAQSEAVAQSSTEADPEPDFKDEKERLTEIEEIVPIIEPVIEVESESKNETRSLDHTNSHSPTGQAIAKPDADAAIQGSQLDSKQTASGQDIIVPASEVDPENQVANFGKGPITNSAIEQKSVVEIDASLESWAMPRQTLRKSVDTIEVCGSKFEAGKEAEVATKPNLTEELIQEDPPPSFEMKNDTTDSTHASLSEEAAASTVLESPLLNEHVMTDAPVGSEDEITPGQATDDNTESVPQLPEASANSYSDLDSIGGNTDALHGLKEGETDHTRELSVTNTAASGTIANDVFTSSPRQIATKAVEPSPLDIESFEYHPSPPDTSEQASERLKIPDIPAQPNWPNSTSQQAHEQSHASPISLTVQAITDASISEIAPTATSVFSENSADPNRGVTGALESLSAAEKKKLRKKKRNKNKQEGLHEDADQVEEPSKPADSDIASNLAVVHELTTPANPPADLVKTPASTSDPRAGLGISGSPVSTAVFQSTIPLQITADIESEEQDQFTKEMTTKASSESHHEESSSEPSHELAISHRTLNAIDGVGVQDSEPVNEADENQVAEGLATAHPRSRQVPVLISHDSPKQVMDITGDECSHSSGVQQAENEFTIEEWAAFSSRDRKKMKKKLRKIGLDPIIQSSFEPGHSTGKPLPEPASEASPRTSQIEPVSGSSGGQRAEDPEASRTSTNKDNIGKNTTFEVLNDGIHEGILADAVPAPETRTVRETEPDQQKPLNDDTGPSLTQVIRREPSNDTKTDDEVQTLTETQTKAETYVFSGKEQYTPSMQEDVHGSLAPENANKQEPGSDGVPILLPKWESPALSKADQEVKTEQPTSQAPPDLEHLSKYTRETDVGLVGATCAVETLPQQETGEANDEVAAVPVSELLPEESKEAGEHDEPALVPAENFVYSDGPANSTRAETDHEACLHSAELVQKHQIDGKPWDEYGAVPFAPSIDHSPTMSDHPAPGAPQEFPKQAMSLDPAEVSNTDSAGVSRSHLDTEGNSGLRAVPVKKPDEAMHTGTLTSFKDLELLEPTEPRHDVTTRSATDIPDSRKNTLDVSLLDAQAELFQEGLVGIQPGDENAILPEKKEQKKQPKLNSDTAPFVLSDVNKNCVVLEDAQTQQEFQNQPKPADAMNNPHGTKPVTGLSTTGQAKAAPAESDDIFLELEPPYGVMPMTAAIETQSNCHPAVPDESNVPSKQVDEAAQMEDSITPHLQNDKNIKTGYASETSITEEKPPQELAVRKRIDFPGASGGKSTLDDSDFDDMAQVVMPNLSLVPGTSETDQAPYQATQGKQHLESKYRDDSVVDFIIAQKEEAHVPLQDSGTGNFTVKTAQSPPTSTGRSSVFGKGGPSLAQIEANASIGPSPRQLSEPSTVPKKKKQRQTDHESPEAPREGNQGLLSNQAVSGHPVNKQLLSEPNALASKELATTAVLDDTRPILVKMESENKKETDKQPQDGDLTHTEAFQPQLVIEGQPDTAVQAASGPGTSDNAPAPIKDGCLGPESPVATPTLQHIPATTLVHETVDENTEMTPASKSHSITAWPEEIKSSGDVPSRGMASEEGSSASNGPSSLTATATATEPPNIKSVDKLLNKEMKKAQKAQKVELEPRSAGPSVSSEHGPAIDRDAQFSFANDATQLKKTDRSLPQQTFDAKEGKTALRETESTSMFPKGSPDANPQAIKEPTEQPVRSPEATVATSDILKDEPDPHKSSKPTTSTFAGMIAATAATFSSAMFGDWTEGDKSKGARQDEKKPESRDKTLEKRNKESQNDGKAATKGPNDTKLPAKAIDKGIQGETPTHRQVQDARRKKPDKDFASGGADHNERHHNIVTDAKDKSELAETKPKASRKTNKVTSSVHETLFDAPGKSRRSESYEAPSQVLSTPRAPSTNPKKEHNSTSRQLCAETSDTIESPVLGKGELELLRSSPQPLLRRGSDVEEPKSGLLREDSKTFTPLVGSDSDISDLHRSPSRLLEPVLEVPEAEVEPAKDAFSTPKAKRDSAPVGEALSFQRRSRRLSEEAHRDSGFGGELAGLRRSKPASQEASRDSGVHTADWAERESQIQPVVDRAVLQTPDPPSERRLRRSPRGTPVLREPAAPGPTPEPEKKKQYGALTPAGTAVAAVAVGAGLAAALRGPEPSTPVPIPTTSPNPILSSLSGQRSASDDATPSRRSTPRLEGSGRRTVSNTSLSRRRTPEPLKLRPESPGINRSSGTPTPPLRRVDKRMSSDLRALRQQNTTVAAPVSSTPVANEGRARAKDMADVYDGFGEGRIGSPRSPTRPHSMRRRQSMQVLELENKVEQLMAENRMLTEARAMAETSLSQRAASSLADRDAEIDNLKQSLQFLQNEVSRLSEVNDGLASANAELASKDNGRVTDLESRNAAVARELEEARREKGNTEQSLEAKDAEIAELRAKLDSAKEKIRDLQRQILEAKAGDDHFLNIRDEDHFDHRCQQLCSHVQQWVLRFSKFSDMRACRLTSEINDEKTIDRLDNAVLDGSDVDVYLRDRVKRRDIFMSMTMNMVWEFVFTRYLFGMDREQRQKLKSLEKLLTEVGPIEAVRQWRAVTLTLLAKRESFKRQRDLDTEAVVQAIFQTLCKILPPPSNLEDQIQSQLRRVMREAVGLSIEMRTQKAEYMMLPPLRPEYDADGELTATVQFNASMMNERSGSITTSNEDLEAQGAIVRVVLFPLVVKKGDDNGKGDEEIVVCPAQVLVPRSKGLFGGASDGGSTSIGARSHISLVTETMGQTEVDYVD
ncbi:hypothetical protein FPCIR_9475 [Fusarium pseudocircinatum]|uniref:Involucrin repeat protein n=1 Tax=Fusarium pseudocircinatum TaxID=56676 RepID=A0A8H5L1M3_9HYPO|nr:hypothetical protein FPCIR_9475 [Fusarium pseudocircinatum]